MTATFSRGSLAVIPFYHFAPFTQFPEADQLGSVTVGMAKVRNRPDADSPIVVMIFRWTNPVVAYDPGDITVGLPGGR